MVGGMTAMNYVSDVWRWKYHGPHCSVEWRGVWEQLTPVSSWSPRYGHSLVRFISNERGVSDRVLMVGGFGGLPDPPGVQKTPAEFPISSHNDIWCGYDDFVNWTMVAPSSPFSTRANLATVVTPTLGDFAFLVFGGYDSNARNRRDFWL